MAAPDGMNDIHPIAPPPEVGDPRAWWVYAVIAVGVLAMAAIISTLVRRQPRKAETSGIPPKTAALDELHTLKRDYAQIPPEDFAARAVGALRIVVADRFGDSSLSLTPDEFFERHQEALVEQFDSDRSAELRALLDTCDRMRFAPDPDTHSERLPLAERAIAFVREIPEAPALTSGAADSPSPNDAHPAAA